MGPMMPVNPKANLDTLWFSEATALQINSDAYEELRIANRALVLTATVAQTASASHAA